MMQKANVLWEQKHTNNTHGGLQRGRERARQGSTACWKVERFSLWKSKLTQTQRNKILFTTQLSPRLLIFHICCAVK